MSDSTARLISELKMATIKAIIDIPDETMEKAVEQALAKIEEDTSIEACCDSCAYEAMAETQYPCNECRYSHKSMWRAKQ